MGSLFAVRWPWQPPAAPDLGLSITLPPELMAKFNAKMDQLTATIWYDGFWRGVVSACVVLTILYLFSERWKQK